jgi:hypothetical protein
VGNIKPLKAAKKDNLHMPEDKYHTNCREEDFYRQDMVSGTRN